MAGWTCAPPRADVPIYVASQRDAGCRVAGRVADGAIMQGCVAEPLWCASSRTAWPRAPGAPGATRPAIELVARINVCIADDVGRPRGRS